MSEVVPPLPPKQVVEVVFPSLTLYIGVTNACFPNSVTRLTHVTVREIYTCTCNYVPVYALTSTFGLSNPYGTRVALYVPMSARRGGGITPLPHLTLHCKLSCVTTLPRTHPLAQPPLCVSHTTHPCLAPSPPLCYPRALTCTPPL